MAEREDKTLEELRKHRLQAEIRKLESETNKAHKEREEIEKRISKKWYITDLGFKIVGLITGIIVIVSLVISIVIPLTQSSNQIAENKTNLAETKTKSAENMRDSALFAMTQAKEKEEILTKKVQMLTARLDSIKVRDQTELDSIINLYKEERDRRRVDKRKIQEYESQIERLKSQIRDTEHDKEQIEKIISRQLSGRVTNREDGSKLSLEGVLVMVEDGTIKCVTDENGAFKLDIPSGRGRFERLIFRKSGYVEISLNVKPPNQGIEIILEKKE